MGVQVSDLTRPTSTRSFEDLNEIAAAYAESWTTATPAQRDRLRSELICRCLPFAGRMARRYVRRGQPFDDLQQVARVGLIKAVDRFDPGRGSFTAFAMTTVYGELKRYFRDQTWSTHVNRHLRDLSLELQRATAALLSDLQREPTTAELAEHLGMSEEQVLHIRLCHASYTSTSLSKPAGKEGSLELGDTFGELDPDLETLTDRLAVVELMHKLPKRIQLMLVLRFYGNMTQAQIGTEFNVSQMQVSRLLDRGLAWLREAMVSDSPQTWIPDGDVLRSTGLRVWVDRSPDGVTARVHGDVDRDTADQLRRSLHSAVMAATGSRLVIDVTGMPLAEAADAVLRDTCRAAALAHVEVTLTGV
jgi:RNA polymerase sigma-B factor